MERKREREEKVIEQWQPNFVCYSLMCKESLLKLFQPNLIKKLIQEEKKGTKKKRKKKKEKEKRKKKKHFKYTFYFDLF